MTYEAIIRLAPDRISGEIDRYLYGSNLEHVGESVYRGLWAEMLRSSKFEGPDPVFRSMAHGGDTWSKNPNHGVVIPWQAINPDYEQVVFDHDNTHYYAGLVRPGEALIRPSFAGAEGQAFSAAGTRQAYTGPQSQRIWVRQASGKPHGISQGELLLQVGRAYDIRLVLKGEGQAVTVRLGDQSWLIPAVSHDWETFQKTLVPGMTEASGRLSITIQDEGNLWVGWASLMPADHKEGFRADAIAAIRASWTPTFLRWPGGNFVSSYHWIDGVGERGRRPAYLDPAWQLWETNDVGTDEFMALCRLLNTEPILTLNIGTGSVEEAVAWVEYCNGAVNTPFGALRAANGHPEPYQVRTWFVGNEQFGNWQDGHSDPETYARRYLAFARAIRADYPDLTLIGVGVPSDQHGHWNERVLQIAGAEMDLLSVHWYSIRTMSWEEPPPPDALVPAQLGAGREVEKMLEKTIEIVANYTDPAVPIAFDEWNTYIRAKPPLFIEEYNLADALYTGVLMNACIRMCGQIKMSAGFNFINVMGNYRISPRSVWRTPATLVLELLTKNRGTWGIVCDVKSPSFQTETFAQLLAQEDVPLLDAAATWDPHIQTVYLSLVNLDGMAEAQLAINGMERGEDSQTFTIRADSAVSLNTEEAPQAVSIEQGRWPAEQDFLLLPPLSFTMVRMKVQ